MNENSKEVVYETPAALTKLLNAHRASQISRSVDGGSGVEPRRGNQGSLEVCPTDQGITFFGAFPVAILEDGRVMEIKSPGGYPYALSVIITREGGIFTLKGFKKERNISEEFDFDFDPEEDDKNSKQALAAEASEEAVARKEGRDRVKGIFAKNRAQHPIFIQMQRGGESIYIACAFQHPVKSTPDVAGQEKNSKR
jgi:hypothetical protein